VYAIETRVDCASGPSRRVCAPPARVERRTDVDYTARAAVLCLIIGVKLIGDAITGLSA
jgi:hypothetical protein